MGSVSPAGIINLVAERAYQDQVEGKLFANHHGTLGASLDISKIFDTSGVRVNLVKADEEVGIDRTSGEREFASIGYHWNITDNLFVELDAEYISREITEPTQYYLLANADGSVSIPPLQSNSVNHGADWFKAESDVYNLLTKIEYFFTDDLYLSLALGKAKADTTRRYSAFYGYDIDSGEGGTVALSTFPDTEYDNDVIDLKLTGQFELGQSTNQWVVGASRRTNESIIPARVRQGRFSQHLYNPVDIEAVAKPERVIANRIDTVDEGYFASLRSTINENWQTTLGYRYVDYTNTNLTSAYDEKEDTISASVMYKPSNNLSFYGSYIEGLEEGGIAQGITANAGEVLPAALSEQYEFGAKYETQSQLMLTLAYFDIDRVSAFIHPETNFYVQDGRANYAGIEFSAAGDLSQNWSMSTSATYIDATQKRSSSDAITGNKIENTPDKTASLFLQYQLPQIAGLSLSFGGFYTSSRYIDALNSNEVGGYTIYDLGVNYQFSLSGKPMALGVYAQNLTDKDYWPATGSRLVAQGHPRTVKLELKMTL